MDFLLSRDRRGGGAVGKKLQSKREAESDKSEGPWHPRARHRSVAALPRFIRIVEASSDGQENRVTRRSESPERAIDLANN
jgi:hypothetical protein